MVGLAQAAYVLITNQHNKPQAQDHSGNDICEGCGCLGHTNTGDGTYCPDYQDDVMADCRCMYGD
jgi:hypothetical protein